jgi:hypothetical protein
MTTTIFSHTFTSNNPGNANTSTRVAVPITGASLGQLRFTFQAGSTAGWKVVHASCGVASTSPATTATPLEITFSGASGWNLAANGVTPASDFITLAATSSNLLVLTFDDDTTGNGDGGAIAFDAGQTGVLSYFGAVPGYQNSSGSGFTALPTGDLFGVTLIETQAAPNPPILLPTRRIFVRR